MTPSPAETSGGLAPDSAPDNNSPDNQQHQPNPPSEGFTNANVPKPKRLACMICRKRKLKCDGVRPSCSTCTRLGHSCAYDEVRRKSGPKRGYVKALEERLKQVETLLKTQDPPNTSPDTANKTSRVAFEQTPNQMGAASANFGVANPSIAIASDRDMDRWHFGHDKSPDTSNVDDFNFAGNLGMGMNQMDSSFPWEMIGLGLEEPLPPQETIDELHQIFFEKIHPSIPMIHKFRYLAAMNLAPNQRPPVALRYAVWTLACSITDKYADLKELFYQRSRKYVEADYIKGYGEHLISVAHAQTHCLLASYEFKMMYFPRAWQSTGNAVRLCQMIGLHRLDGTGLEVKQCLPPPRDWTEREERRRTFWMAFCQDRYASIGTGWPLMIDERDILTNLPSTEDAFEMSRPEQTQSLLDSMTPSGAGSLSSFAGIVLMACLFGRNLVHLHRPDPDDRDNDLNGEFWKRHRNMDNILLNTSLCLPDELKLPMGLSNPNVVFTNMNIHTSTICLHQAAIFKADKNRLPASVSAESKVRCITAANEIASIMRMVSHLDLSAMNPFISFCLYVAARVFVQYLKSRPDDSQSSDSLRFLLAAMNALKRKNPLTESFLVQLDVDLEALGTRIPKLKSAFPRNIDRPAHLKACGTIPRDNSVETGGSGGVGGGGQAGGEGPRLREAPNYMRLDGDDGGPLSRPDIIEPSQQRNGNQHQLSTQGYSPQAWMAANGGEEPHLPTRERSSGPEGGGAMIPTMMFNPASAGGYVDNTQSDGRDMSGSSNPDGPSNRPTPNSSSNTSDNRQSTNGRTSFDAGSIGPSPQQNMRGSQVADMERNTTTAAFFSSADHRTMTGGFHMAGADGTTGGGTGMAAGRLSFGGGGGSHNSFVGAGSEGWMSGGHQSTGMTPVAEGVLRNMMDNLPTLDTMDLGWNSGT